MFKRNIFLLIVLISCLFILQIYFSPESEDKLKLDWKESELVQLDLPNLSIIKKNNLVYNLNDNMPLDLNAVGTFFYYVNNLEIVERVPLVDLNPADLIELFSDSVKLVFTQAKLVEKIEIGTFQPLTGLFPVKWSRYDDSIFWFRDENAVLIPYENESEVNLKRYLQLKKLLNSSKQDFFEKKFLATFDFTELAHIEYQQGQIKGIAHFDENNLELKIHVINIIKSITAKDYFPVYSLKPSNTQLLLLKFGSSKHELSLSLYQGLDQLPGFYIKTNAHLFSYQIGHEQRQQLESVIELLSSR
jgi:hypothetical protein